MLIAYIAVSLVAWIVFAVVMGADEPEDGALCFVLGFAWPVGVAIGAVYVIGRLTVWLTRIVRRDHLA
jgi:Kef-type K+ transport system membrane component KefB